ncbi:hypothetical protein BDEG_27565 [Batrachochytrium dendrobatidis JEL423]|uniref:Prokaryotic-type class I peptide chain release factors domain-containing protein n=1 Tax=Batrachochytrium dendrobatidis (strain JEL423) TaxID=403673 RepID=A0A177WXT6_BATDL|nr:hypothetical protein BDEG_27565 [Batrachochytrium dendrobatidis JEL423]
MLIKQTMQSTLTKTILGKWQQLTTVRFVSESNQHSIPPQTSAATLSIQPTQSQVPKEVKKRLPVQLVETDLVEKFTKGSGPGGQKINKRKHSVQLWHTPTGLFVETQRFRELASNRREARKLLLLKLDQQINGDVSKLAVKLDKHHRRVAKQKQRSKKKYGGLNGSPRDKTDDDESV